MYLTQLALLSLLVASQTTSMSRRHDDVQSQLDMEHHQETDTPEGADGMVVAPFTLHQSASSRVAPCDSSFESQGQIPTKRRDENQVPLRSTHLLVVDKPSLDSKFGVTMTSYDGLVTVRSLDDDSALKREGLAVGDRILEINHQKADGARGRTSYLLATAPIGQLELLVQRFPLSSARLGATKEVLLPKAAADSGEAGASSGVIFRQSGLMGQLLIESDLSALSARGKAWDLKGLLAFSSTRTLHASSRIHYRTCTVAGTPSSDLL